jgi:hypothetical protein
VKGKQQVSTQRGLLQQGRLCRHCSSSSSRDHACSRSYKGSLMPC